MRYMPKEMKQEKRDGVVSSSCGSVNGIHGRMMGGDEEGRGSWRAVKKERLGQGGKGPATRHGTRGGS